MFNFKKTINFLSVRRITTTVSIALMIFSLVSITSKGLNPGIDFTGGFQIEISYQQPPEIEDVRNHLSSAGFNDAIVQNSGSATDIMIRIAPREELDSRTVGKLIIENLSQSSNPAEKRPRHQQQRDPLHNFGTGTNHAPSQGRGCYDHDCLSGSKCPGLALQDTRRFRYGKYQHHETGKLYRTG